MFRVRSFSLSACLCTLSVLSSLGLSACKTVTVAPPVVVPPLPSAPVAVVNPIRAPRIIKIGLALGGGAARGFAHIGVIKALESQGIQADIVVGTSAGSVVGALYAAGNSGFALQKMAIEMDEAGITDWTIPIFSDVSGVLKGEALQNYMNKAVKNVSLENLKLPFGAVATDLHTGLPILFRRGNTGLATRASSSVPGVFQPVKIGGHEYVDGGLVSPVPVRYAHQMGADFVIAVNISAKPASQATSSSLEVLLQTFTIMGQSINHFELKEADIVISPNLGGMKANDFDGRNLAILAGEQAAFAVMPMIKKKLQAAREQ
jgi:NTE family protein